MPQGLRIYNLFPLLAGPVERWHEHLPRIAEMGFNWVYLNPFHYPGFSGSLYAIKDPYRLHPLLQGDSTQTADELLRGFVKAASALGLRVMMDLVINHAAKDALLAEQHPDWFKRDEHGELYSPRAINPDDTSQVTIWGDLAELDYSRADLLPQQIAYWSDYLRHYQALGFSGFRCDAAYQVPCSVWAPLIDTAKTIDSGCLFAAETLGCTLEQVVALRGARFDYFFNSVKWWDFKAPWLLEQYELYRHIAPTIGFPDNHDTERLAADYAGQPLEEITRQHRLRYLLAAAFSSGVMMLMGYEYGFHKRVHVIESRPEDWQAEAAHPQLDLVGYIAAVNRLKAELAVLNVEGWQAQVSAPDSPVVALLRLDAEHPALAEQASLLLINLDTQQHHAVDPGTLLASAGGRISRFTDVTPDATAVDFEPGTPLTLLPGEFRLFRGEHDSAGHGQAPDPAQSRQHLEALAANRVLIENVSPELNGGRFAVKRVVGDVLHVEADIVCDGHDVLGAAILYRPQAGLEWHEVMLRHPHESAQPSDEWPPADSADEENDRWSAHSWREAPMRHFENDRWIGQFPLTLNSRYVYTLIAWRDVYASWRHEISKKFQAGQDVGLELTEGRTLIAQAEAAANGEDQRALAGILSAFDAYGEDQGAKIGLALGEDVEDLMARHGERANLSRYPRLLEVFVDRTAARFSAWYEMFPRSASGDVYHHGSFKDVITRLPYVKQLGFDVLYFPPIHPIGRTNRKGRNNSLHAGPNDPGSPYAIGSEEGGHDAIHPQLGSFEDFAELIQAARAQGLEIALDFAIQCSPDHPWLKQHPEWFNWRPDGSIKFAENPPKKYEDIVNVHFYERALPELWYALRDVVLFWADQGVRIFRVDNPHTKPLPFWEWMIREVQERHPDVLFFAEAFTRPKMMYALGKLGFSMSYTYFTWRDTKWELQQYLTELTQEEPREFYRPNFFVNTPDINPYFLQSGQPAAFLIRAVLASTLSSLWGMYNGFEICEGRPVPGKEEYLDSEKYEIKAWDFDRPGNIKAEIAQLNRIRRENPALHDYQNLRFYNAWNDNILVYGKMTPLKDNAILVAVNVDPNQAQEAHFEVPLWEFGLPDDAGLAVEDLFTGEHFQWHGKIQHVWLDPHVRPFAVWRFKPLNS